MTYKHICIFSSQRSGSTLLALILLSYYKHFGYTCSWEYFHLRQIPQGGSKHSITANQYHDPYQNKKELIRKLHTLDAQSPQIIKVFPHHIDIVFDEFKNWVSHQVLISLERQDVREQLLSYGIARKTHIWNLNEGPVRLNGAIEVNLKHMEKMYQNILLFRRMQQELPVRYFISYEEIVKNKIFGILEVLGCKDWKQVIGDTKQLAKSLPVKIYNNKFKLIKNVEAVSDWLAEKGL